MYLYKCIYIYTYLHHVYTYIYIYIYITYVRKHARRTRLLVGPPEALLCLLLDFQLALRAHAVP